MNITSPIPAAFALLLGAALAAQSVPTTLNYQGRLTDNTPQQAPVTALVPMQFEIWDGISPTGSNRIWREPDADAAGIDVPVSAGIFSVMLGQANPLPPSVFSSGGDRYLQIILNPRGTNPEFLQPRQQIGVAPFSALAQTAGDSGKLGGAAAAQYQKVLTPGACPAGQSLTGIAPDGTASCAAGSGGVTQVNAAGGLTGSIAGATLTLDTDGLFQRRSASAACAAGNYLDAINPDGSPSCRPDLSGVTAVAATQGISGSIAGSTLNLSTDVTVQRRNVAPTCPAGQYLQTIAVNGAPTCVPDAGVSVPMSLSGNLATPVFSSVNNGAGEGVAAQSVSGYAIRGTTNDVAGGYAAVTGVNPALGSSGSLGGSAALGPTPTPIGAYGGASTGWGVYASTGSGRAVNASASGGSGSNYGVYASTASGTGIAVYGLNTASGNYGRLGDGGEGVYGGTSTAVGVRGEAGSTGTGVLGYSNSNTGTGVSGSTLGGGTGVSGSAGTGNGVKGTASSGIGVLGTSAGGSGVWAETTATSGLTFGLYAEVASAAGYGVYATNTGAGDGVAVYGQTLNGYGLWGHSSDITGSTYGVYGTEQSTSGAGVYGKANAASGAAYGVVGESDSNAGAGVRAIGAGAGSGTALQVEGGGIRIVGAGVATTTAAFIHVVTAANKPRQNVTCIDNAMTNGHGSAILQITPVFDKTIATSNLPISFGAVYNPTWGDGTTCPNWAIYINGLSSIPDQMRYHILVIYP